MLRELLSQTIYGKKRRRKLVEEQRQDELLAATAKISVSSIASTSSASSRRRRRRRRTRANSGNSSIGELASWLRLLTLISDKDQDAGDLAGEQEAFVTPDGEIEDDRQLSREKLLEKIREKKAVIEKLRCQPWPMRRKRRTLTLAQKYLQRHESKVSKTHLLKEELTKKWKKFQRWLANVSIYLIPWEAKIKTIESHFGSVVSSYFTFLRWIFWVNVIMTLFMVSFIVIPECIADAFPDEERRNDNDTLRRKQIDPEEMATSDNFQTVWDYKGHLTVSPLFYGYYSNKEYILKNFKYQLPLAYFLVNLFTLGYSFFAILRRMAANTRLSKLTSGKTEQYPFAWKMFTGWDYTIGNGDTAANTVMANANKFREAINEFKIKIKEDFAWILFLMRILANILILGMITSSTYAVYYVVGKSHNIPHPTAFEQNQVAIVISFITLVFPNFFELISKALERFHPRTALRVHLGRVLALYLLNFYTLIIALFTNIHKQGKKPDDASDNHTLPRSEALIMDRNDSLSQNRFSRSLSLFDFEQENATATVAAAAAVVEPILHLTTFLLTNATSSATSALQGAFVGLAHSSAGALATAAPIPPLIHFLKRISISRRRSTTTTTTISSDQFGNFSSASDFFLRFARQTDGTRESYYRYATDAGRRSRTTTTTDASVTGPLLWTTVHPEAGPVGVSEANAFLRENISDWLRNNTNDLETFPPLGVRNGSGSTGFPGPGGPQGAEGTKPWQRPGGKKIPGAPGGTGDPEKQVDTGGGVEKGVPGGEKGQGDKVAAGEKGKKDESSQQSTEVANDKAQTEKLTLRERQMLCWETWVGQEIAKLITMDLVMTIASILVVDFFRGLCVRYCNRWWCWNLETVFPEYGEFKVAENVLHIINNQGMIWLGLFFSPLLPVMNNVKLIIIMYIRGWACMTCNVPATQVFRASRSNNFYLLLLLLMLFLCTLPVGYVIAKQEPSKGCGPFSYKKQFYKVITDRLEIGVPKYVYKSLENLASPGIIIPVLVLLALIIYFLVSLIRGLREANQDLQKQLVHERTEEKRKIYQLAGGGKNQKNQGGRPSFGLPETKKIDLSYLPSKEKTRREAWRSKAPLSDDESLIRASDNELSTQSPSSVDTVSPATPSRPGYPDFPPIPAHAALGASASSHFVPSLKSLPEEGVATLSEVDDGEDDDRQKLLERSKSDTLVKHQPTIIEEDSMSKSTPETERRFDMMSGEQKDQNHWAPAALNLSSIPETGISRFSLLGRHSPQQPTITTPLLAPTSAGSSRSASGSSSRSHSPLPPKAVATATAAAPAPTPRFPVTAEANLSLAASATTPVSESRTASTSTYENNYPTPISPMSPYSPNSASSSTGPFADLTARQVADMLSPTKFSPRAFQEFMLGPSKKKPTKSLKVVADVPSPAKDRSDRRIKADVLIHMSDTDNEKYPSDSGRATWTERSMTTSGDAPSTSKHHRRVSGAETDTGTESEMEKFAKSRLRQSIDQRPSDFQVDWEPDERDRQGKNGKSSKDKKLFPKPVSTTFVPWPSPDPLAPKTTLKHVGPPRRGSASPNAASPPPTPAAAGDSSLSPLRRFTLSVSPSRIGSDTASSHQATDTDGDGSPGGKKKRYIIRQTPSPSPKLRRARPELPTLPTKLSVVSEITMLPRLSTQPQYSPSTPESMLRKSAKAQRMPQPDSDEDRRMWASSNVDNNNKERPSRAHMPSRSQLAEAYVGSGTPLTVGNIQSWDSNSARLTRRDSGSSSTTSKSKKHPSKETMI